jgi:hypothetical protein
VGVVLADSLQIDGFRLQVPRAFGRSDYKSAAGVGNETAVQHAKRVRDRLCGQHLVQRDGLSHVRIRMQRRVFAGVHGNLRQLLASRAIHVHVALRNHCVISRDRTAIRLLEVGMADSEQRRDRGITGLPCCAVLPGADENGLRLTGDDSIRRMFKHDRRAGAADDH